MKKWLLFLLTTIMALTLCLPGTADEAPAAGFSWKDLEIGGVTLPLLTDENMQEDGPIRKMAQEGMESGAYGSSVCWSDSTGIQSDSGYDLTVNTENRMTLKDMIYNIDWLENDWSQRAHDEIVRIYLNGYPCIGRIVSRADGDGGVVREINIQGRVDRVDFNLDYSIRANNDSAVVPEIGRDFILDALSRVRIDGEPLAAADQPVPFVISGPTQVFPGSEVQYSAVAFSDQFAVPGDVVLTAEGSELDAEGSVTVAESAQTGDSFTVTASSAEAGASRTLTVTVAENLLKDLSWTEIEMNGVTVPMIANEGWNVNGPEAQDPWDGLEFGAYGGAGSQLGQTEAYANYSYNIYKYTNSNSMQDLIRNANQIVKDWTKNDYKDIGQVYINGYPAVYGIRTNTQNDGWRNRSLELYAQMGSIQLNLYFSINGGSQAAFPPFGPEILLDVLPRIRINGEPVDIADQPVPFAISGSEKVYPGTKVQYSVLAISDDFPLPGDVILTAEGAELDAEGYVTVADSAQTGDTFTITASSAETGASRTLTVTVTTDNPLKGLSWTEIETNGVTIPMISNEGWNVNGPESQDPWDGLEYGVYGSADGSLGQTDAYANYSYNIYKYTNSASTQDLIRSANQIVKDWTKNNYEDIGQVYINGYPAVYGIRTNTQNDGWRNRSLELYAQMGAMQLNLSFSLNGGSQAVFPPFGPEILLDVLPRIRINGEPVEIADQPVPFAISGPEKVYPGTKVQYSVLAVSDDFPLPGDVVLSTEGAELDAEGYVTITDSAQAGDVFTITASSAEAGASRTLTVTVTTDNPLKDLTWTETEVKGITVPLLTGNEWNINDLNEQDPWEGLEFGVYGGSNGRLGQTGAWSSYSFNIYKYTYSMGSIKDLIQNAEQTAKDWSKNKYEDVGQIYINGYPAVYGIRTEKQKDGYQYRNLELYAQMGSMQLSLNFSMSGDSQVTFPPVTPNFLLEAASRIKINGTPVEISDQPDSFVLSGPSIVYPGTSVAYTIAAFSDDIPVPGDVKLTAEGTDLNAEGKVVVPEDAKPGDTFIVTASSAEASLSRSLIVTVAENPLLKLNWTDSIESDGFTIPMPSGEGWSSEGPNSQEPWSGITSYSYGYFSGSLGRNIWMSCSFSTYVYKKAQSMKFQDMLKEVQRTEKSWSGQLYNKQKYYDEVGRIYINGLPVVYAIRNEKQDNQNNTNLQLETRMGTRYLYLNYYFGSGSSALPEIGPDFLEAALSGLKIDGQPVTLIIREPVPSLSQADGVTETVGGAKIQYTSGDPDPAFGKVIWEVSGEDGSKTKAATVDKKGLVTAGKAVKEITKVIVKARYENCSKAAETVLTVYPPMKKLNIVASDTFLYVGSSRTITLTASPDPEGSKLMGLTWKAAKEGLAEIQDNGDGTVTLTPVAPGALTVTATEAGGVKGTVKITVTDKIVTAAEIAAKGAPAPGKAVTLTAKLTPAAPARKDVTWSIDVDETIAKIDAKGKLTIAKDAPAGTVITVTCTALGAPEPVEAKLELTVE